MIVRNIPDRVMKRLQGLAKAQGLSVEALARRALAEAAERQDRWAAFLRWAQAFHRRPGPTAPAGTGARLIREDRGR